MLDARAPGGSYSRRRVLRYTEPETPTKDQAMSKHKDTGDGLFDGPAHAGVVTRDEAALALSDLVSALSEGKPKDGLKANVELRERALREGRRLLKRLLTHGWDGEAAENTAREPIESTPMHPTHADTALEPKGNKPSADPTKRVSVEPSELTDIPFEVGSASN